MSGHRVLGVRPCACRCGRTFVVTTRRRGQRFYSKYCFFQWDGARFAQRIGTLQRRKRRFGEMIAAVRAGTMKLHDALARADQLGFDRGRNSVKWAMKRRDGWTRGQKEAKRA